MCVCVCEMKRAYPYLCKPSGHIHDRAPRVPCIYLLACQAWVTVGDPDLCCCVCVTSFESCSNPTVPGFCEIRSSGPDDANQSGHDHRVLQDVDNALPLMD